MKTRLKDEMENDFERTSAGNRVTIVAWQRV